MVIDMATGSGYLDVYSVSNDLCESAGSSRKCYTRNKWPDGTQTSLTHNVIHQ